jgi:hypothetical protein
MMAGRLYPRLLMAGTLHPRLLMISSFLSEFPFQYGDSFCLQYLHSFRIRLVPDYR